jgi:hypothetical protein
LRKNLSGFGTLVIELVASFILVRNISSAGLYKLTFDSFFYFDFNKLIFTFKVKDLKFLYFKPLNTKQ